MWKWLLNRVRVSCTGSNHSTDDIFLITANPVWDEAPSYSSTKTFQINLLFFLDQLQISSSQGPRDHRQSELISSIFFKFWPNPVLSYLEEIKSLKCKLEFDLTSEPAPVFEPITFLPTFLSHSHFTLQKYGLLLSQFGPKMVSSTLRACIGHQQATFAEIWVCAEFQRRQALKWFPIKHKNSSH